MKTDLKCPICNQEMELNDTYYEGSTYFYVSHECSNNDGEFRFETLWRKTERGAINAAKRLLLKFRRINKKT